MREIVMARKLPRRIFVQPHLSINDGKRPYFVWSQSFDSCFAVGEVQLVEFGSSTEGIIQSFLSRFPGKDSDLEALWHQDKHFWN